ncbi:MAG TPA: pyridoxal-dependent decarboxylase [Kofleriaceae bacterium]|nr:pyridoxal-dependent decarboxylase [Kofleriaceae bacterium]
MSQRVPSEIRDAYDPERFRRDGHALIDTIADQLARWHAREGRVLPWREPAEARIEWGKQPLSGGNLVEDLARILEASTALAHPHCMAHQVPPPLPSAVLAEAVSALLNNGMAVYEMGPAAVPIELAVIDFLCARLGYAAGAGGVLTSGGSLGNLTALLAMRQAKAGFDMWKDGAHAGPPLAVIVSDEAHYSVARTLGIMGWGAGGAIAAPVDARHRMTAGAVAEALRGARDQGRRVIGIVAAAGSTATGAFDPLDELAELAAREGLWLHVDAAHGGGVALSAAHRGKLAGIERADSVVWDAHKLLMMPALVTAVLFKHEAHAYEAFAQRASYLFAEARPETHWWDLGTRTLECTKRAMAIELWTALRVHGEAWFGEVIDRQVELTRVLAAKVAAAPDFELAQEPELNIVCYRMRGVDNRALRERVVEDGRFYVVGTELADGYYLRSTIMNPLIEPSDFDALLDHLRSLCR